MPNLVQKIASYDAKPRSENQTKDRNGIMDQSVQGVSSTATTNRATKAAIRCDKATDQSPVTDNAVTSSDNCLQTDSDVPQAPVKVTCGRKQICTALECPSTNNSETMISIHLLLFSSRISNPNLTLAQLKEDLCRNMQLTIKVVATVH